MAGFFCLLLPPGQVRGDISLTVSSHRHLPENAAAVVELASLTRARTKPLLQSRLQVMTTENRPTNRHVHSLRSTSFIPEDVPSTDL